MKSAPDGNSNVLTEAAGASRSSEPLAYRATVGCCRWYAVRIVLLFFTGALAVPAYCQAAAGKAQPPQPISPVMSEPSPEQSAPPPPPTLEHMPPRAPQVVWDGSQLSIKCENSTLADILRAVSERLKVPIEIPAGAGAERVVADLGPSSARDVLTDLLSGSRFNYIIQASDTQENSIKSLILSPRGSAEGNSGGAVVAQANSIRRMPGHEDIQRNSRDSQTADNSENAPEQQAPSAEVDGSTPASDRPAVAASAEQSQAPAAPAPSTQDAVPAEPAANVQPSATVAGDSTPSATNTNQDGNAQEQQVQDLRSLYEERRRMQAQQNRTNSNPPTANPQSP